MNLSRKKLNKVGTTGARGIARREGFKVFKNAKANLSSEQLTNYIDRKTLKECRLKKDLELADTQVELATIEVRKRVHPLITRFGEGAGLHDDVGRVGMAFIRFTGDPSGSGKERPVLVIAKNKKTLLFDQSILMRAGQQAHGVR